MEILDLRHFSSLDLRPLLDDETQLWSRLLSWDYTSSAEMILRYVDAKILPGYAAVDRGRVFGYSFFVYEGSKGVIGDLYVTNGTRLPDARKVEINLLTHVIETLQQSPGIHRVEAQLLAHEANVVSRPFLETGFQRHPRLFMVLGFAKSTPPNLAAHADVDRAPQEVELAGVFGTRREAVGGGRARLHLGTGGQQIVPGLDPLRIDAGGLDQPLVVRHVRATGVPRHRKQLSAAAVQIDDGLQPVLLLGRRD